MPSSSSFSPSANGSVAIAVGATNIISPATGANTTGFFVSDTGENIAIGQYLDLTAAIGVSGAGSDYAIKAKGDVDITGIVRIYDTSPTTSDFKFENGKIYNPTKSLHHDLITDPTGVVYLGPADEVVSSGNFSYGNPNGSVIGTWTKVAQVITVMGTFNSIASDEFFLPVQGGGTISNVNGVANYNNASSAWRVIQSGVGNAKIYRSTATASTGEYSFSLQYIIT
jgi:hypothetical protein